MKSGCCFLLPYKAAACPASASLPFHFLPLCDTPTTSHALHLPGWPRPSLTLRLPSASFQPCHCVILCGPRVLRLHPVGRGQDAARAWVLRASAQ